MMNKINLKQQLLLIYILIIGILVVSLGIILPTNLLPTYEDNLYNYLKQPLNLVNGTDDFYEKKINTEVAYIYVNTDDDTVKATSNVFSVINMKNVSDVIKKINHEYGKFKYKLKTYYYYTSKNGNEMMIALTDDSYIEQMRGDVLRIILSIVGVALIFVALIVVTWSSKLVSRINKLKDKVNNINNDSYDHQVKHYYDDELLTLDVALENMRMYLKEQEQYKNQMYQNISHDFKTPITVMKSYIEASEDGIETQDKALEIIKEQLNKLEIKVHSLLYLNKLNYIQERKELLNVSHDVSKTIDEAVNKFKNTRPSLKFILDIDKKNTIFRGSASMWEAIIDNILNNFMRYAKDKVQITVKNGKIILYNDGPNIDDNVLNNIFTPYEKGVKGVFGLGLSIVKKTLQFLDYDIVIENVRNGVKFIIKERK